MPSKSATRDGLISGSVGVVSRTAIQLCLLLVTIVAVRFLPMAEFGVYSIAAALMFLCRNLFYVGPYEYLLKTEARPTLAGSCLVANLSLATCAAVGLAIFAFASASLFGTTEVRQIILYLIPSVFIAATTAWFESILLRKLALRRYYACTVLGEILGAGVAVALLTSGFGLLSLVAQVYVRLGSLLLAYVSTSRAGAWTGWNDSEVRKVMRWSWSRYGAVCLNFSASYGADFVLAIVLSPAATGLYRASNRIVSALTDLFAQPLQKIVQTNVSARAARGLAPDRSWLTMFTAVTAIAWAALVGLAMSAREIVPLVLGENWKAAGPVVVAFCAVRALGLIDATTTSLLVSYDRQRFMLGVQICVALAVPLTSLFLAQYGPVVVALANGCVMAGLTVLYCREASRISGATLPDLGRAFLVALTPACGVAICVGALGLSADVTPTSLSNALIQIIALAGLGFAAGLLLVRQQFLSSVRTLSPSAQAIDVVA
jgi:O-antigen/teichoic acid export membrane protein